MSDCHSMTGCASQEGRTRRCPESGGLCKGVSAMTVSHHVSRPWEWSDRGRAYFFCDDPGCDVVYFSDDDQVIRRSGVRTEVGQKRRSDDALLCYCFGVSRADARRHPAAREFVLAQTRLKRCACETRNPSGRCCLKDFPRGERA